MKKHILSMIGAFILCITCFAPLNVSANFRKPTTIKMHVYDTQGTYMNTCDWSPGSDTAACGTDWRNNANGFGKFIIQFYMDLPTNYTVEFHIDTFISGINYSDNVAEMGFLYYLNDTYYLDTNVTRIDIFNEGNHRIDVHGKYTNTTGSTSSMMQYEFTTNSGTDSTNFTMIKLSMYTFNVYDEQGRLVEKIENGFSLLNSSINNLNTSMTENFTGLKNHLDSLFHTVYQNFQSVIQNLNGNFANLNNTIILKLNEVINAIKGDGTQVDSKDEVQNSTDQFEDTSNQYNEIESGLVDDFQNNLGQIQLDNDLYQNNDFLNTGTFIATQMTRVYNSNDVVRMLITYGMIVGLAFTIIGISVRR